MNVLPFVVLIALSASACGSSSKSSTAANPPVTPSSSSTASTASTPTAAGGKISSTTPITAPVVRTKFITEIVKGGSPPATARRDAGKIADCAISKLKSQGVTTAAGLKDAQRLSKILVGCARPLGVSLR